VTRAELEDERTFLLDSLEDLERERTAGDLSDADYAVLRDRYTRRAAEVLHALEGGGSTDHDDDRALDPGPASATGRVGSRSIVDSADTATPERSTTAGGLRRTRRRRTVLVIGSLAIVAAVAVTIVATQTGARLPGQTATGSVSLSRAAQLRRTLEQAEALESTGNASGALRLYLQVLVQDPKQPEALAESGWLEFEAGVGSGNAAVLSRAQSQEEAAERADSSAYAPHLYLGSMLLAEGNATGAVGQYRQFLADDPPDDEVQAAQTFITEAFRKAGQPLPALPGSASTTPPTSTAPTTTSRPAR
jgi:tetratricopeptide (TPR) repeat protein